MKLIALCLLLTGCAIHGNLRVGIEPGAFSEAEIGEIAEGVHMMGADLAFEGPTDVAITRGAPGDCHENGHENSIEHHVTVWPECLRSVSHLRWVVAHELGHVYGMQHVCLFPGQPSLWGCSPVGYGRAVMNPVSYESGVFEQGQWSDLDRAELVRQLGELPAWAQR